MNPPLSSQYLRFAAVIGLLMPTLALAHVGQGDVSGGFIAGFEHPILGLDHVVAMIAVGLWGAQLGPPAIWVLPVTFPLVMALGGLLGGLGVELPSVEIGIATSAVVLGAMVTLAMRPPLWVAGVLVGLFAIFHGYAHGAELPESANPLTYALGFVVATGSLHLVGITLGLANRWSWGTRSLQAGGAVIASCGVYFLLPHLAGA